MAVISPTRATPTTRMAQAARAAGMPRDQLKSFLAAGYVPQEKQMQFHAACRLCDHPGGPTAVGFGGARGPGKSHASLAQVAMDDCQRFDGLKVLYLRKVGKSGREAIQDQRRSVLKNTPHEFKSQEGMIVFPNGSRIIIGHFKDEKDIDAYLGLEYDLIIIEEATTLSQSKVKNIRTCLRTSKAGWRPRVYYTTNPGNLGHAWFKALFIKPWRDGTENETRFIPATVYDNRFVNREYRRELETLVGWQKKAWLEGDWDVAAGQFFTNWRHNKHVLSVTEMPAIEASWRVWGSLDYGYQHYTCSYLMSEDGDGNIRVHDEHAARKWLVERHTGAIDAMLERHRIAQERLSKFVAGHDVFAKKQNGTTIADDYKEHGYKLLRANVDRVNGAAELLRRLGDVDGGIDPTLFVSERCTRLIECIPILQHDPNQNEDVLKVDTDDDGNGGDDPYDAARYGVMAAYRRRVRAL